MLENILLAQALEVKICISLQSIYHVLEALLGYIHAQIVSLTLSSP